MKKGSVGFFKRVFLVITDFRTYPFIVKHDSFLNALLYIIILTFLLTLVLSVNATLSLRNTLGLLIENYDSIPDFEYSNGQLSVSEKLTRKNDSNYYYVVDTDYTYKEFLQTTDYTKTYAYDNVIIINKDAINIEQNAELQYGFSFKGFNVSFDKSSLYNEILRAMNDFGSIFQVWLLIFVTVFFSYCFTVSLRIIIIACIISMMCFTRGIKLDFKNYTKLAIYTYTLPFIVEVVITCIVGAGKDYSYWGTLLLLYVYIIYAIRALKLDAFIMMISRRGVGKDVGFEEKTNDNNANEENNEDNDKKE